MDNEELSSDTSCLVDITDLSELNHVEGEVAISEQADLACITTDVQDQHSSDSVGLKVEEDHALGGSDIDKSVGGNESVYQIEPNGVAGGYIILSQDNRSNLGIVSNDEDETGEPPAKRLHFQGEDGQSYVLTVSENSGNVGSGDDSTVNATGVGSTQILVQMPNSNKQSSNIHVTQNSNKKNVHSNDVNQAWFTTRDDKQALQNTGASWKQGQWTKEEVDILQNNINTYCKENNIGDPTEIIFEMTKDERKDFYRTVAKGLQRPLFSVYRRVTRMYDQKNYVGKYSPDEMQKLKELRGLYGNDWASIGHVLGRSASSVKDKCRLMKDTCNSGKWLPMEEKRLCNAVYELTGAKQGENVTSGLSWACVAEKVGTRSEKQCRTKWLNYLNWKQKGGIEWTREDDISLIMNIANLGVSDDTEIDWTELSKNWPSVRSPQWLRGKWWSLKRHAPDYKLLPFPELLEYLKTCHYQTLRVKNQMRMTEGSRLLNIPVSADTILNVPVAIQTNIGEMDAESLQALETTVGTFLITQPQTTVNGSSLNTDHIIVHAIPGSDGMSLQMNPSSVILSAENCVESGEVSLDSTQIKLDENLPENDQDLETLTSTNEIIESESENGQSDLATHIISSELDSQSVTVSDIESSGLVTATSDVGNMKLVLVSSNGETTDFITSFSDPMLTSGGNDLNGSSDMEGDKGHHHDNQEPESDITSVDISESGT